jgi:hypothetical protein
MFDVTRTPQHSDMSQNIPAGCGDPPGIFLTLSESDMGKNIPAGWVDPPGIFLTLGESDIDAA